MAIATIQVLVPIELSVWSDTDATVEIREFPRVIALTQGGPRLAGVRPPFPRSIFRADIRAGRHYSFDIKLPHPGPYVLIIRSAGGKQILEHTFEATFNETISVEIHNGLVRVSQGEKEITIPTYPTAPVATHPVAAIDPTTGFLLGAVAGAVALYFVLRK